MIGIFACPMQRGRREGCGVVLICHLQLPWSLSECFHVICFLYGYISGPYMFFVTVVSGCFPTILEEVFCIYPFIFYYGRQVSMKYILSL